MSRTSEADLTIVRRAYARQIAFLAGSNDPRLERALAEVPREAFLGVGPWGSNVYGAYRETPDADPAFVYQDYPSRPCAKELNNGQPSFLARLIGLCGIREGDAVVHVGAGTVLHRADEPPRGSPRHPARHRARA